MEISNLLRFQVLKLLIMYFGIPLGTSPRNANTWQPMVEKIEKRLPIWKANTLCRAGRLTLIKSVMNNLPIYYLSFFKIPKAVAKKIISLLRNFFLTRNGKRKKVPLVAWEIIQKPKHFGGHGVGDIVIKNSALLFKWWWRFLEGNNPLWKRVITSNHYSQYDQRNLEIENEERVDIGVDYRGSEGEP